MDETWIQCYTPKSNASRPKHPKLQQSTGNVLATIFWDALKITNILKK